MRILHTADWHIGCRTDDLLRLDEQRETCKQIVDIANNKNVDMVIIAGDVYDSFLPSAESERLLFNTLVQLSNNGNRAVVVIAGNHDDPKRLSNANVFAASHNIYLVGEMAKINFENLKGKDIVPIDSGIGYIEFLTRNNEKVVVAAMPYPSYYRYKRVKKENENINDSIKEWFEPALSGFRDDTINIAVSHLLTYPVNIDPQELENHEILGGVISFVDRENLYSKANYTALGHIHQQICVDKNHHIYYSGSTINKFFDEITDDNFVLIAELDNNGVKSVDKVLLDTKALIMQKVSSIDEAFDFLKLNTDKLVKIVFTNMDFVNPQEIKKIKTEHPNVITISIEPKIAEQTFVATKRDLNNKEIFEKFVENKTGEMPDKELTTLFLQLMDEVLYETD